MYMVRLEHATSSMHTVHDVILESRVLKVASHCASHQDLSCNYSHIVSTVPHQAQAEPHMCLAQRTRNDIYTTSVDVRVHYLHQYTYIITV